MTYWQVKVKFTLEQAMKAQKRSRRIAILFLYSRRWQYVGGQRHARPLYPRESERVPVLQETGWSPGPVWTSAANLEPTEIWSPDRPDRSESLYRLRSPGPLMV
jgi:hypothetical protein